MRVLVACECSNTVRDAFLARGHDAYSCDVQRADHPNLNWRRYICGDVRPLLREKWDLVIAHPPCTYLSVMTGWAFKSGMPSEESNPDRYARLLRGVYFFVECLSANASRICVENPIPNAHARKLMGDYTQIIHPWEFGHPYTKKTCLWLYNLPPLVPTDIVQWTMYWVDAGQPGNNTRGRRSVKGMSKDQKHRSKTFQGIADAMAEQWGCL